MTGQREARLDAQGVARLDFTTLVDAVPAPWQEREGVIRARVTIQRPQLETLRNIAVDQLMGELPSIVRGALEPWVQSTVTEILSSLGEFVLPRRHRDGAPSCSTSRTRNLSLARRTRLLRPRPGVPSGSTTTGKVLAAVSRPAGCSSWSRAAGRTATGRECFGPAGWRCCRSSTSRWSSRSGPRRASRVTQTDTAGEIPWMLREDGAPSGVTSHVEYLLVVAVDGQAMRVRTYGTADEQVEGQQLLHEITESAEVTMPIEPAPPGACP